MRRVAAIDGDGVVFRFLESWKAHAEKQLGRTLAPLCPAYELARRYGLTDEEVSLTWDSFGAVGGWRSIPPYAGAVDAIRRLERSGMEPVMVTSIPASYAGDRRANLRAIGLDMTVVAVGTRRSKRDALKRLRPACFFDDAPWHIAAAAQAGVPCRVLITDAVVDFVPEACRHATLYANSLADAVDLLVQYRMLGTSRPELDVDQTPSSRARRMACRSFRK